MSSSRTQERSTRATSTSSREPERWPCSSFTDLNRSRSMKRTVKGAAALRLALQRQVEVAGVVEVGEVVQVGQVLDLLEPAQVAEREPQVAAEEGGRLGAGGVQLPRHQHGDGRHRPPLVGDRQQDRPRGDLDQVAREQLHPHRPLAQPLQRRLAEAQQLGGRSVVDAVRAGEHPLARRGLLEEGRAGALAGAGHRRERHRDQRVPVERGGDALAGLEELEVGPERLVLVEQGAGGEAAGHRHLQPLRRDRLHQVVAGATTSSPAPPDRPCRGR